MPAFTTVLEYSLWTGKKILESVLRQLGGLVLVAWPASLSQVRCVKPTYKKNRNSKEVAVCDSTYVFAAF